MLKRLSIYAAWILLLNTPVIASEQDAISTDIFTSAPPGSVVEDNVVAQISGANAVTRITGLGLPAAADIAALHFIDDANILFALKSAAQLGSVSAHAGDVLHWADGTFTLVVSGATLGLGPATGIDALTMSGDALVFSTDIADTVNGNSVSDSDLLTWSNSSPTALLIDQIECGIPAETNLSAVHRMGNGDFLMAFSTSVQISGINSRRGDVMRCDPVSKSVSLYRRFTDVGSDWAHVKIDALTRAVETATFSDGFEKLTNN